MTAFLIKSGICMVLFFGLYWFILRKEKLFIFNRYYLIVAVVFSLTVPFISFPVSLGYKDAPALTMVSPGNLPDREAFQDTEPVPQESFSPISRPDNLNSPEIIKPAASDGTKTILYIYIAGFIMMFARFCRNILQLRKMLGRSEKMEHEWYRIALVEDKISPFSFFKTVFLNRQDYIERRVGDNVMNHELEHIRQAHSLDIIFFEIFHMAFWFNPVLFLYKRAARINHEYLADEAVVTVNSDIRNYTDELISFISHRLVVPYTSGFSPSMIRLRLLMLNSKTSRHAKIKRVLLTVLMSGVLIGSLSMKPEYKEPDDRRKKAAENRDIIIQDVFFRGKDFNPLKALVVLNGKKLMSEDSIAVDISDIKTLNVLNDRKAKRKYGKNARNGVVEISTYGYDKSSVPDSLYYKPIYTINNKSPEKRISIQVSNIYSASMWTYPVFRNQEPDKRWRLLEIFTRDYYKIEGRVMQSDGKPLSGILVSSSDNPSDTITGNDGHFILSDINPGSRIDFSADGFITTGFTVPKSLYYTDLAIRLRHVNEPDSDLIISGAGKEVVDFSGRWRLNKELSKITFPGKYERVYDIHQYDADSLKLKTTTTDNNGMVRSYERTFVFNTVKANMSKNNVSRYINSCIISPDGQSFSVTSGSKSIIQSFREYKQIDNYSLSDDGKQLLLTENFISLPSSGNRRQFPAMVFDRE